MSDEMHSSPSSPSSLQINEVCRLCLAESKLVCSIFSDTDGHSHQNHGALRSATSLPQRIMSCAEIKVVKGDGLPSYICQVCLAQVDKSYQFKLQCETSDAMLRKNLLSGSDLTICIKRNKINGAMNGTGMTNGIHVVMKNGGCIQSSPASLNDKDEVDEDEIDDDDNVDEGGEEDDDSDVDYRDVPEGEVIAGVTCDSESVDGWEVMKFTPEVIINEEDTNSNGKAPSAETGVLLSTSNHNGIVTQGVLRNINSGSLLAEQQLYQLSQVEAILRNHGTEIKVQHSNKGHSLQPSIKQHQKQDQEQLSIGDENNSDPILSPSLAAALKRKASFQQQYEKNNDVNSRDYLPMFGGEAVLDDIDGDTGPSAKTRRSRDGEKLFKCQLCPKSYSFSSALSRHKAVHNMMLRPYVCPICKKGFAEPEKLERHSKTHLIDRTWTCNNCGRIFKALNTYERHVTTICSYRNKENGGGIGVGGGLSVSLPPGLSLSSAHHPQPVISIMSSPKTTIVYRNS